MQLAHNAVGSHSLLQTPLGVDVFAIECMTQNQKDLTLPTFPKELTPFYFPLEWSADPENEITGLLIVQKQKPLCIRKTIYIIIFTRM